MTDRELLEKAAQAAGLERLDFGDGSIVYSDPEDGHSRAWNPLRDDGDAFRLAVDRGMTVRVDLRAGFSWVKGIEGSVPHGGDPRAATRRAIVRAAAALAGD